MRIGGESTRYDLIPVPPEAGAAPAHQSSASSKASFVDALRGLGSAVDRGEALMARATRGASGLDSAQLIALQAGIYRYSEAVDLVAKLVDRASTAVRTVVSSHS